MLGTRPTTFLDPSMQINPQVPDQGRCQDLEHASTRLVADITQVLQPYHHLRVLRHVIMRFIAQELVM